MLFNVAGHTHGFRGAVDKTVTVITGKLVSEEKLPRKRRSNRLLEIPKAD